MLIYLRGLIRLEGFHVTYMCVSFKTYNLNYSYVMTPYCYIVFLFFIAVFLQDTGNPSMSTTFTLTVNILDVLNVSPVFSQTAYNVEIAEGDYSATVSYKSPYE